MWELALQAIAVGQPTASVQILRYRQQGWLPQGFVWITTFEYSADQCGSLPCRRLRWISQLLWHRYSAIASRAGSHRVLCGSQHSSTAQINVGACPAGDCGGSANCFGTGIPLSPAGLAPTGFCVDHNIRVQRRSMWELALQAIAVDQPTALAQVFRYRQQGWLPQGFVWITTFEYSADQCGSLPCRRWRWVSQLLWHRYSAIASRAGSHRVLGCPSNLCLAQINVGACPASDGGESANCFGTGIPPSPAGLAPTGFCVDHNIRVQRRSMWELALQAMAVGQPTALAQVFRHRQQGWLPQGFVWITRFEYSADPCGSWLASDGGGSANCFGTDTPLSPAGLAPTGFCVDHNIRVQRRSMWELALQAMAVGQPTALAQVFRYRQQGWLPQGFVWITTFEYSADQCGSWLASDGGGSANCFGTGIPLSPAGLAPTGFCGGHKIQVQRRSMWELALQAMAVGQPTHSAQSVIASRGRRQSKLHETPT